MEQDFVSRLNDSMQPIPVNGTALDEEWQTFIDDLLPDAPNSSVFTKCDFVTPAFVVDAFIEKRKDEPLEQLQQLLTEYASRIRSASAAIIDEDYADFIHLSSNLMGVGKAIDKVVTPLEEGTEHIRVVRDELFQTTSLLETKMNRLRQVRKAKADILRMKEVDKELSELEVRLKQLQASADDPVRRMVKMERLKVDLLEVERILQSVTTKCKLFYDQQNRFTELTFSLEKIRRDKS